MKKPSFSTILTLLLCAVFIAGAVTLGAVRGWINEREQLLLACPQRHSDERDVRRGVAACEEAIADFDARLSGDLTGRIAGLFGVEPIGESLSSLHRQLLRDAEDTQSAPDYKVHLNDLTAYVSGFLNENVDTTLSLGKVVLTILLLMALFGKRKKGGFPLGKLLAGFGLLKLWKKR